MLPITLFRRRRERSRGQSLVEFVLILPVLLILLVITLDFGRLFMSWITLNNLARVAANFGATNPTAFAGSSTPSVYVDLVDREGQGLNCDLQPDDVGNNPPEPVFDPDTQLGDASVVSMTCNFTMLTPLLNGLFGGALPMSARAEFPIRTGAIQNLSGSVTVPDPGAAQAAFSFTGVSGGAIDGSGNVVGVGSVTVNVQDASTNADTYLWSWGDGETDSVKDPPAHSYSIPATYTVRLTVTNSGGTVSWVTRTVTVESATEPPPIAGFYGTGSASYVSGGGPTGAPIQGTLPLAVAFTNTSSEATSYSWDFGDGGTPSTTRNASRTYSSHGQFTVVLTLNEAPDETTFTRSAYIITGCVVPNFSQAAPTPVIYTNEATTLWSGAGFSGTINYKSEGSPGGSGTSTTPPSPAKPIVAQSMPGGQFYPATQQNKNSPWLCANEITLTYQP